MNLRTLLVALLLLAARSVSAAQSGFVYVIDPATGCQACAGPQVLIFDGGTTKLVARIPLPKFATPAGIAVSSNFAIASSSVTVIDARRHVLLATYAVGSVAGLLAVNADDSAVFIRAGGTLYRFDTATHGIATSAAVGGGGAIAFSLSTDAVVVGRAGGGAGAVTAYDPVSLVEVRRAPLPSDVISVGVSRTGARIFVLRGSAAPGQPAGLTTLDAATFASLFPGYANTHSAVGYFVLDTTTLSSGVHRIAWLVRDDLGRTQGIGSRYFTVQNP
jgi:hypothetical protein